jgi:integrase
MVFTEKIYVEPKESVCYDEIQANKLLDLLESVDTKFKVITNLALASGCRIGELGGLTWDCIDFQNNTINIKQVAQYISKLDKAKILQKYPNTPLDLLERNIIIKQPKTKKSKRDIPIHSDVMELLSDYQHKQKVRKVELANKWKKDSNWVFTDETGDLMHPHTGSKWFHKFLVDYNTGIMQDEEISEDKKKGYLLDEITFHALRHSNASLLIAKGNDIAVVSKRLGHSNVGTTARIYIHSSDTMRRKAADSMDMFSRNKAKENKAN